MIKTGLEIWKSRYLNYLFFVVFFSILSFSILSLMSNRVQAMLNIKSAEVLGGDKVLYSPETISFEILEKAKELNLETSLATVFLSMVSYENNFALAEVKAVDKAYPLRGFLKISDKLFGTETNIKKGPESGKAWVEPRLMVTLNLKINDKITIGESSITIDKILNFEPDRVGETILLAPQVLINYGDLQATGVLIPGSRIQYKLMLTGSQKNLKVFEDWVNPYLNSSQELVDIKKSRGALKTILERMQTFLNVLLVVNLFFSISALFIIAGAFIQEHRTTFALLRCIGASTQDLLKKLSRVIILLGLFSGLMSLALGILIDKWLSNKFHQYLAPLEYSEYLLVILSCFIFFFILLTLFLLPTLFKLRLLSPVEIFRSQFQEIDILNPWLGGLAFFTVGIMLMVQLSNAEFAIQGFLFGFLTLFITWTLVKLLINSFDLFSKYYPSYFKLGLRNIIYRLRESSLQISCFTLALSFAFVFYFVQNDLLKIWKSQIPDKAPNYFAINISPREVNSFQEFLTKNNLSFSALYPIVRARLISINDQEIQQNIDYSQSENDKKQPRRLLNLSESRNLPKDNTIIEGQWFKTNDTQVTSENKEPLISIEKEFATRISAKINDTLTFRVGEENIKGRVSSIREVQWDNFQPNFYVLFSENELKDFPKTYLTSFYSDATQLKVLSNLIKSFPSISLIEIEGIISQLKILINALVNTIYFFLGFTAVFGFILFALILSTLVQQRARDQALFKILGASQDYLIKVQISEYFIVASLSSLIALVVSIFASYWILVHLLKMSYIFNPYFYIMACLGFILIFTVFGLLMSRRTDEVTRNG